MLYDNLMARNNPAIHSNFETLTSKVEPSHVCKIDNKKFLLKDFFPPGWVQLGLAPLHRWLENKQFELLPKVQGYALTRMSGEQTLRI